MPDTAANPGFVNTRWSVVLSARQPDSPGSRAALEELCRTYWSPLYAFIRRQGHPPHDAQDLTQTFFARLLEKNHLDAADPGKGRFRTFLLVALKRFLANEWHRCHTRKRGGSLPPLPLDTQLAEQLQHPEPSPDLSAERLYDRQWALTLLNRTMLRLRQEFTDAGRSAEFDRLKGFLIADRDTPSPPHIAASTDRKSGAVRVAVHRLRRRFRELFREEIARTVSDPGAIDAEVGHLLAALSESR